MRPTLETLEPRNTLSTVSYHGGAVLQHPEVANLFVGTYRPDLDRLADVQTGPAYTELISVYGVSPGTRDGSATVPDQGRLSDGQVRQLLAAQIAGGALPAPDGQGQAYAVYLEQPTEYGPAYHWWFTLNGIRVPYSVAPSTGSAYDPGPSHELLEMVTDPYLDGWYAGSPQTGEIGDLGHGRTMPLDGLQVVVPVGPDGAYLTASTPYTPLPQQQPAPIQQLWAALLQDLALYQLGAQAGNPGLQAWAGWDALRHLWQLETLTPF